MTAEVDRSVLFERFARTGAEADRNALVEAHLGLAEFFAKRYRNRGVADDDLRQVARLALVQAVDRFDPEVGVEFSTFAGRTIDGTLKRHFRDTAWSVRVPRSLQELSVEVRRTSNELSVQLGRSPTIAELAEATGRDADLVVEALEADQAYRADSLDVPDDEGGVTSPGSVDGGYARRETQLVVRELIASFPERERRILELRFDHEKSQSEIAEELGISQMHVSRLLRRCFEQMRARLTD